MRIDDLWSDDFAGEPRLNIELLTRLRSGPVAEYSDVEAAIAIARVLHEEFEKFGTDSTQLITQADSREGIRTLKVIADRLGISFDPPFRDLAGFRAYWGTHGGYGSWAARREMVRGTFDPLHEDLEKIEEGQLREDLVEPISPKDLTGWPAVDVEIAELRRHFHQAQTPQDYRNIGNDVVAVLEAVSEAAYDHERHLFEGETEPPVAKTKNRLARVVEVDFVGEGSDELVRLAKASIETAQAVKHNPAGSRVRAGIAADAVIQVAHMIRRVQEPK